MSKKINELAALTDSQAADSTGLVAIGNPANGLLKRATVGQIKLAISTFKKKYVADGTEGTALLITELAGKEILSIAREGSIMYEVESSPDTVEFTWDGTTVELGLAVAGAGERFLILYKTT